jgi:hypothetical protein
MSLRLNLHTISLMVVFLLGQAGCYATTQIHSHPANATVVMDNKAVLGKTPIQLTEMTWIWTKHSLLISKEGYSPTVVKLKGEFRPTMLIPCFCTFGVALPMVLIGEYPASHFVTLEPISVAARASIRERASVNF